jgi:uncharacterized GH25 family protein
MTAGAQLPVVLTQVLVVAALALGCAGGTGDEPLLLTGSVVDAAGRPVPDARVALTSAPVDVPDLALLTGGDGGFSIAVPAEGVYGVAAVTDEGRAEETVDVRRGAENRVRLILPR